MTADPRFTYGRAVAGYDEQFVETLRTAISTTIAETSFVSDAPVMAVRSSETIDALVDVLAQLIAVSDLARSPTTLRKGVDKIAMRLRQHATQAAADSEVQDFKRRCFRAGTVGGHA